MIRRLFILPIRLYQLTLSLYSVLIVGIPLLVLNTRLKPFGSGELFGAFGWVQKELPGAIPGALVVTIPCLLRNNLTLRFFDRQFIDQLNGAVNLFFAIENMGAMSESEYVTL